MELATVSCGRVRDADACCCEVGEARPGAGTSRGRPTAKAPAGNDEGSKSGNGVSRGGLGRGAPASWQTQQGCLALLDGGGRGFKEPSYL